MADTNTFPAVAIVHSDPESGGRSAVWHIDTDPSVSSKQFVGAWLLEPGGVEVTAADRDVESWAGKVLAPSSLRMLVEGRPVIVTPPGREVFEEFAGGAGWLVDGPATVEAVVARVEEYRQALREENERRKGAGMTGLRSPSYPRVPQWPQVEQGADVVAAALDFARGVREIVEAWNGIDAIRRAKSTTFLSAFGGREMVAIPLVRES